MLLTRLPLGIATPFDLHVLGTPPALVLSQDQTLHNKIMEPLIKALRSSDFAHLLRAELNHRFTQLFCTKSRDPKDIAE